MSQFGYFGVFLLIMIENVFPPIPSEVILTFGGFMTTYSDMTRLGVIIAATAGSVIGAMILYSIGLFLDVARLERIVDRWGGVLRLDTKRHPKSRCMVRQIRSMDSATLSSSSTYSESNIDSGRYVEYEFPAIHFTYNNR